MTFDTTSRPAKVESQVEVLTDKPARPHKVIARIQIGPDAFVADYQRQTNILVKRAAELGADAAVVTYGNAGVSKFTAGEVIVYQSDATSGG